jgi:hypothetical protein
MCGAIPTFSHTLLRIGTTVFIFVIYTVRMRMCRIGGAAAVEDTAIDYTLVGCLTMLLEVKRSYSVKLARKI